MKFRLLALLILKTEPMRLRALTGLLFLGVGCERKQVVDAAPINPLMAIENEAKPGRFQIVGVTNMVALDTKTGLICKTWDWDDSRSETNFPMCVNLLTDENNQLNMVRGAEDAGRQLKREGFNPYSINHEKLKPMHIEGLPAGAIVQPRETK